MSKHDVIVVKVLSSLRIVRFHPLEIHPLWSSDCPIRHCSFVIQSKKHLSSSALQKNEQEFLDKRQALSYKPTYLPSPTLGKCTIS